MLSETKSAFGGKKILIALIVGLILCSASPALAANNQTDFSTRVSYAKEWLNLNLFTWKAQSKVKLLDRYATDRAEGIKTTANQNNSSALSDLVSRYSNLIARASQIIQKDKNKSSTLIGIAKTDVLSQQKTLSEARQNAPSENDQKTIASTQEKAVNTLKQNITDIENSDAATNFSDQVVAVWRDPEGKINSNEEKATRVYAAGTTENGTIDEGVIIDGGQAKIVTENNQLKIEYAPGTGPNSVTGDNGKKLWKIVQSDGSVIESYTSGGNVVIGKSSGVSSNIVVNTVSGGTSGAANVVVGNSGGSANTVVVGGGKSVVTVENSGDPTGAGNTVNNSTSSTVQSSPTGTTSSQTVQQVAP